MPTGDGLLARLPHDGPLTPVALMAVCRAAGRCGNGLMEVTARGSLQARGLTMASARAFAEACLAAGIADHPGPPVIASPLGKAGPGALADISGLAAVLRPAAAAFAGRIAPKVAIVVDDGGALHLDGVTADIRLRALCDGRFLLGVAGEGGGARWLGAVAEADAVAAACALLGAVAGLGAAARGHDLDHAGAIVVRWTVPAAPPPRRAAAEFVGIHALADGTAAGGVGLLFGQAEAGALETLAEAALDAGATGFVPAPGRVLLAIGLQADRIGRFLREAARLGFITRADDLRRRVIACAGAPACSAALMPARAIAGVVAEAARPLLEAGGSVHLSGCGKGCASRKTAALTLVGTPRGVAVIRRGAVGDAAECMVAPAELVARAASLAVPEPA
jgi:precorrin-3B synthase